jgi:hypothetical protein
MCNVLQYELAGYGLRQQQTERASPFGVRVPEFVPSGAGGTGYTCGDSATALPNMQPPAAKKPLMLPPYVPKMPAMSMDPSLLQSSDDRGLRNGATDKLKSLFTAYIMCKEPTTLKKDEQTAFDSFANSVLLSY